ncbi:MAG: folylpolyglutamate synthase/dihydrofolate synthase family protein [Desulfovibrionaceae bacterium]
MSSISSFISFADVEAYLDRLGLFHMDMGLGRVRAVLGSMGLAHPAGAAVQVVGTNGKGSTANFLAALARAHGLSDGLYTSPHFLSPRERIRIQGHMLSETAWVDLANRVLDAPGGDRLTYFELLTVMAACAFRDAGVRVAVFEAGLGGSYDATSALGADVVLFASISLDHESVLGRTVAAIATDKAGAMAQGRPALAAITGPQSSDAMAALAAGAARAGVPLRQVDLASGPAPGFDSRLFDADMPQRADNARLALAGWLELAGANQWATDPAAVRRVLAEARLPGRLQCVAATPDMPPLILDGAHNEDAMAALAQGVARLGVRPSVVVFSCLRDKRLGGMLPYLARLAGRDCTVVATGIPGCERSRDPDELARELGSALGVPVETAPHMAAALEAAVRIRAGRTGGAGSDGPVLVCGSLYLLAEFYTLRPDLLG